MKGYKFNSKGEIFLNNVLFAQFDPNSEILVKDGQEIRVEDMDEALAKCGFKLPLTFIAVDTTVVENRFVGFGETAEDSVGDAYQHVHHEAFVEGKIIFYPLYKTEMAQLMSDVGEYGEQEELEGFYNKEYK